MFENLDSIEEAIEDIRNGKVVLVFDDVARENEGDFIAASELVTPEIINFMAKFGRGLICVAITEERAQDLKLERMVQHNTATMATANTGGANLSLSTQAALSQMQAKAAFTAKWRTKRARP